MYLLIVTRIAYVHAYLCTIHTPPPPHPPPPIATIYYIGRYHIDTYTIDTYTTDTYIRGIYTIDIYTIGSFHIGIHSKYIYIYAISSDDCPYVMIFEVHRWSPGGAKG